MLLQAERASLLAESERTIRAGSKSFRFASNLFDQRTRERAWLLYAWCRACDDLIDDHLAGFALDAAGWRPATDEDLLRYCYHVAGAVGCMMAVVMGVSPDEE